MNAKLPSDFLPQSTELHDMHELHTTQETKPFPTHLLPKVLGGIVEEVARVTKRWSGLLREAFTNADTFRLQFHKNLDQDFRMLVLATAFAIDMDFFENNKRGGFGFG